MTAVFLWTKLIKNQEDFQSILEKRTDFVYNGAYRMMNNAQDVEDIIHMTDTGYKDVDVIDWAADPSANPKRLAINSELREEMGRAIASLPPDLRGAVVLRDIQEFSNAEASDALGITVSSLKARFHLGRVLLRKQLENYVKAPR